MARKTDPKRPIPLVPETIPWLTVHIVGLFRLSASGSVGIAAAVTVTVLTLVGIAALILTKDFSLPAWVLSKLFSWW